MAPKLLRITIIHVLLWNIIFSLSESIELNEDSKLLSNSLRDRVRYTTHICDRLKNSPPVVNHNNYEPHSDGVDNFENPGLAKDLNEPSNPVKRHAIIRCYNRLPAQENNEPNKPEIITSEWQMKSTPVNNEHGDSYDHSMVQKSKVVGIKEIDFNSQKVIDQEPLYHTVPFLQKGNLIGNNPKHSLLQLSLQDSKNKIKSLISTPQHKLGEIISDKLVDESLHNKLARPSLTLPSPPKFIKYPVINPLIQPPEILTNVDTPGLITDSDKQSNPLKPSPLLPNIPNNNFYHKDLTVENKPFLSLPSIQLNKPKPVDIFYDRRVPPIVYRPTVSQYVQTPVIKPILPPILVQKEVSYPSKNEQAQANIGLQSQYPKIIKNGIAELTSQPILIEKENPILSFPLKKPQELIGSSPTQFVKTSDIETFKPITIEKKVSIYLPYKKQQGLIDLSPPTQFTSDTETAHKPITIEKEVQISEPKEQKQPIVDLPPQAPQLINTPVKESIYQETPGQTIVSVNVPYEEKPSIVGLTSPPRITEPFSSESTSQIMPSENEFSMSSAYEQQQPIANFSPPPPPQLQQIKIQKEISIPLSYQQQMDVAPIKVVKTINTELISQKKNAFYNQQQPIILPSPPPLTKTTTLAIN
ncbi:proline-rich extensin-like protein EPR1 [Acyrthosiphon pisum]|uniref:Uncharacterized protein n=1 Tax=Acyrthosiphon pisum TaxID=7029 RepID=A0A8R2AA10_ACYPI|nr:proline-rich extensin-like protein EPR1 [Acyrthosiphon pisum]|eukprot:XP_001948251.2 PREDICTED: proline-rich extensin-like protein EPR1 [Acyrthosiphon pisum]